MAITRYCIKADGETDGLLRNEDSFVLVPDRPSEEFVEIGINDCSGFFPAVRWLDKEDDYVAAGLDFFQTGVPCLVSWDADNIRWIIGAAATTINDRIWLGVPGDTTIGQGNARLSFTALDNIVQVATMSGGRPASTVVLHNGRKSGALVRLKFIDTGVQVVHKGVPFTEDIEMPAGSKLELVCLTPNVYSMVAYTENLGGPGFVNSDFVYTEFSRYAKNNTPYGVNTNDRVVGIVLPADPVKDNFTEVLDVAGNCGTQFCYILRNPDNPSYTIDGFDETFIINLDWGQTLFVYDGEGNWAINPDAIGAEGEEGVQGSQGYQGNHGVQGNPGVPGPQGPPGESTAIGPQGPQGADGPQGDDGADSTVAGPQGTQGVIGNTGPQGADSTVAGPQGTQGSTGGAGPQGVQGVGGPQGFQGNTGSKGNQGDTGPQGSQGADSTVAGPQGFQGDTGPQGTQGFQGLDGSGSAPHGLTTHTDVDTAVVGNGQVLTWDLDLAMWVPKTVKSVLGVQEFAYRVTLPPSAIPNAGRYSRDNADPNLATTLYLNALDLAGDDVSLFLENIDALDWLNVHDDANVNNSESFDVTGPAVLNGNVFEIPVVIFLVEGAPLANNQQVRVFWRINQEPVVGPQGPQGVSGADGSDGAQGPQGSQGPQGDTGVAGADGTDGAQGDTGATGTQGASGPQGFQGSASTVAGPQGDDGAQGLTGPQGAASTVAGPQGDAGAAGGAGPQGDAGPQGATGAGGAQGDTGPQGAASTVAGPQGDAGAAGAQGDAGAAGAQGDDGAQGVPGDPSTVAGPQGDDGASGAQGTAGPQGNPGIDGAQGLTGSQGAQGDDGADSTVTGPQGADGTSVTVTVATTAPPTPATGDIWIDNS